MPRFAILTHDAPFLHWDLLLEGPSACRTWRLLTLPDSAEEIQAEPIPDHRLMYLDYEGPVSGNRGSVAAWDRGTYEWISEAPTAVRFRLLGQRLNGIYSIVASTEGTWLLTHDDKAQ